jgi:hypothetical protein
MTDFSFFNPWSEVFESRKYPHAQTYRTTFGEKLWATFKVFSGNVLPLPIKKNYLDSSKFHFGIIDYLTLGIYYLINVLPIFLIEGENARSRELGYLLSFILSIPRILFASVMTLVSFIPVAIVQAISSFEGDTLKNVILTHPINTAKQDEPICNKAFGKLFKENLEDLDDANIVIDSENSNLLKIDFGKKIPILPLNLAEYKDLMMFDALKKLNIGRLQTKVEDLEDTTFSYLNY